MRTFKDYITEYSAMMVTELQSRMSLIEVKAGERAHKKAMVYFGAKEDGGFAFNSLRAAAKKMGDHGTRNIQIHWNEELIRPYQRRRDITWTRVFNTSATFKELRSKIEQNALKFEQDMPQVAKNTGLNMVEAEKCMKQYQDLRTAFNRQITDHETAIQDMQMRVNRSAESHRRTWARPLYSHLASIQGKGCLDRMKQYTDAYLKKNGKKGIMFVSEHMIDDIKTSLAESGDSLTQDIEALCRQSDEAAGGVVRASGDTFKRLPRKAQLEIKKLLAQAAETLSTGSSRAGVRHEIRAGLTFEAFEKAMNDFGIRVEHEMEGDADVKIKEEVVHDGKDANEHDIKVKLEV